MNADPGDLRHSLEPVPLEAVLRGVWALRRQVAMGAAALFLLGAAVVLAWPRSYVAQAIVAPAETTGMATSGLLSAGALLPGTGILDTRPGGNFAVYLDAIRSPEAAEMLARETPLLAYLDGLRASGPGGALRWLLRLQRASDLDDARSWLDRRLSVTQSVASVTFTLALSHHDRAAALDLLRRLHAFAEARVRADLADLAARRLAAVQAQLAAERDLYLRGTLYELLGQQQRAAVVVGADRMLAARLVSAPMVEERPSVPNRPLLLLLLLLAAPMAAAGAAAAWVLLRPRPARGPGPRFWVIR